MVYMPLDFGREVHCEAVVVTCIDYRFQRLFERWLRENFDGEYYDRVAYAGSVKNWAVIYPQIQFAVKVHQVKRVILISHEDCRAYEGAGDAAATRVKQLVDLHTNRIKVLQEFPEVAVELYHARLAGYLEPVK